MKKLALCCFVLVMVACKKEAVPARSARSADVQTLAAAPPAKAASQSDSAAAVPAPRMIVRNASVSVIVRDAVAAANSLSKIVDANGGYIAESKQWKENDQMRATAVLRVPANRLWPVLQAVRALAQRVESESITAQDVSQEYVDLSAQLRNLQATEAELRELLRTVRERTQKAADIMEVYSELTKTRGEIERIQGRMQYLTQTTAMSTITVDLVPDALAAPVVESGWQPLATVRSAARSLLSSLKTIADVLIWFVLYIMPLVIVFAALALAVRAIWHALRRVRQRPAA